MKMKKSTQAQAASMIRKHLKMIGVDAEVRPFDNSVFLMAFDCSDADYNRAKTYADQFQRAEKGVDDNPKIPQVNCVSLVRLDREETDRYKKSPAA